MVTVIVVGVISFLAGVGCGFTVVLVITRDVQQERLELSDSPVVKHA